MDYTACNYKYVDKVLGQIDRILRNAEYENEIDLLSILRGEEIKNISKTLLFSKRKKLEKIFEKWAEEYKVSNNSFNVITYLALNNLLDKDKVKEFLEGEDNE